ncbi:MAG: ribonuclease J, partial [Acidimicrobiales bacterium]|nr:ribonuclease J [Acidimicrobiales bacterium]
FVPVHGEYLHLTAHARLAHTMGLPEGRIVQCEDGDQLTLSDEGLALTGSVPAGYLYVDGIVGDVGDGVLRDRRVLAEEGVVVVIVTVDSSSGEVITGPDVITRGWVYAPEADDLLDEAADAVADAIHNAFAEDNQHDIESLQRVVRRAAGRFVNGRTKRRPMIVPVVLEA